MANNVLQSTPKVFKRLAPGKPLSPQTKQVIINVYCNLRKLKPEVSISNIAIETAELTGTSRATVFNIKRDCKTAGRPPPSRRLLFLTSEEKKVKRLRQYDSFTLGAIRRKVHQFFRENIPPSIDMILESVNADEELPNFSKSTLNRLLREIGFEFKRRKRDSTLIDREDIQVLRRKYLRAIKKFRAEGRSIYYLDETWVNAGHYKEVVWHDTSVKSACDANRENLTTGLKAPSGKGSRLIITHAGNENGFVEGAEDIFIGKKGNGDYHEEMDGRRFENWFTTKLLPNIEDNSVIVMDNASYHSVKLERIPTKSSRKAEIQAWLTGKNIPWTSDMIIRELMVLVESARHQFDGYRIDTISENAGHTVLRLPPYHCELNPIEMVWGHVKGRVAAENHNYSLKNVKVLTERALATETPAMWKNSVNHVIEEEKRFWELDGLSDTYLESFIISVNASDSSDDDDEA